IGRQKNITKLRAEIIYYLPNDSVSLAVIDWEEWRPTWKRNWGAKKIYQNKSIDLVMHNNQTLSLSLATKKAELDFEKAAKNFMLDTLKLGKSLRPSSYWGYYLFPDCYNHQYVNNNYNGSCFEIEKGRNNELNWLWNESTALYPSIYLNTQLKSSPKAALFARNRVQEAIRVSKVHNAQNPLPVFVYVRPVFTDASGEFLSQVELVDTVGESVALGASGIIVWGSLNLSKSEKACKELQDYMKTVLNPYLLNVSLAAKMCSQVLCQGQGICIRKNRNSADYLHLNPDTFKIEVGEDKEYQVHGKPTDADLKKFTEKFDCSCYSNMNCTKNVDVTRTVDINVCFANVCISSNYSQ
ncbi:hyaluronidase PH-20-like, partial [Suncus etruscus]|uniref:hyaluronidase PH-20-like n=1 Tax=Suncus etruscus TaxID=109475 RepID=UPI00210F99A7